MGLDEARLTQPPKDGRDKEWLSGAADACEGGCGPIVLLAARLLRATTIPHPS